MSFAARVEKLERGHARTASVIEVLVEDIDRLAHEVKEMKEMPPVPTRKIGFQLGETQSGRPPFPIRSGSTPRGKPYPHASAMTLVQHSASRRPFR